MDSTRTSVLSGILFGSGLAVSQMTDPAKVTGFLDITGTWDPTLAFVMGGALLVSTAAHQIARRRRAGQGLDTKPVAPGRVDARLLLGATLFGVGWGLAGFCPGPALAALVTGSMDVALFALSMIAGMGVFQVTTRAARRHA